MLMPQRRPISTPARALRHCMVAGSPRKKAAPMVDSRGLDLFLSANPEGSPFLGARDLKLQDKLLEKLAQQGIPAANSKAEFGLFVRECLAVVPSQEEFGMQRSRSRSGRTMHRI